ncbi:DinB family protein [Flagellimonas hymeniacidonis]|uniref:DinB family protein n=1 Tax=Flagellimonas hymeniacidonis TaxID=2603628 RepID=A0A5C8V5L6_9FLAO|nr:DinB family protein [Flagellimonas hymeniacidonis]TXN36068.1 DinB family protein [Flagellimonas hymeniacidonis]
MIEQKTSVKAELLSSMFEFQGKIFDNAFENLTEELALKCPSEHSNHSNWLLGHILHSRYMLANMLGDGTINPFGEIYWKSIENGDYPTINEISKSFAKAGRELKEKLLGTSDAELEAKPAPDKPALIDIVSFFLYHEAYHLGQLGYARKIIGLEAMKSH